MVIFVDRTTNGTEAVVAVCQYIRHWELRQSGRTRRLDDPDKGDVMAGKLIKTDGKIFHVPGTIMFFQDPVGDRPLFCRIL